jgi:hypothetical protein
MPFTKIYSTTLKKWVEEQTQGRGNLSRLHARFQKAAHELQERPISLEGIRRWMERPLTQEMDPRSLKMLARVRGESIEQTQRWLETGVEQAKADNPGCYTSLIECAQHAPIEEIPAAISLLVRRLQEDLDMRKQLRVSKAWAIALRQILLEACPEKDGWKKQFNKLCQSGGANWQSSERRQFLRSLIDGTVAAETVTAPEVAGIAVLLREYLNDPDRYEVSAVWSRITEIISQSAAQQAR